MRNTLIKAFRKVGLNISYKKGEYLNIFTDKGHNCEFYPCGLNDELFTATYRIKDKGRPKSLEFYMPTDLDKFVSTVCQILKVKE